MSVVVTGCNGFLGRLLVSTYKSDLGEECHGLGTSSPENAPLHSLESYRRLTLTSTELASWIAE
ncbi:MAG: hypothetical protein NTW83_05320, partial [Cyanobacteria bacterium]|nr:hypothetical protein [Cyanobacteriota bacterium]